MSYYRRSWAPLAWGVAVALALLAALWWAHTATVARAFADGRRTAADGVVFDSLLLERAAVRVAKSMAHTDTVWLRAKTAKAKTEAAITTLPPEIAALPPVDTLVRLTQSLLVQVDSLGIAHTAERAAWTERAKVDSAAIYALRILGTARGDTIATLAKRPTKKKAAALAIVSVATVETIKTIMRALR